MTEVVLIGKVTGSTPNFVELEYPSTAGVHSIRLPRVMVSRFERLSNDRVAVQVRPDDSERGQSLANEIVNEHAPLHITAEQMTIVSAFENSEPIPDTEYEEVDDETPMWATQSAPMISVGVDGEDVTFVDESGPFSEMLYSGGRNKKASIDWDFDPFRKPAFVMHGDENNDRMGATIARVNNEKGEPEAYHIFNPLYASENRPAGAYLGTFSKSYYPMPYRKGFGVPLDMAAEKGWPAQVLAWNEGKQAACFIDVTNNVDWDKANAGLGWNKKGFANQGDYRVGIAIYNSLDGSSAYKIQAIAQKLACSNGQVMGDRATLISLKHTNGVLGQYDFEGLGETIMDVIETAAREILVTESMKDIKVDRNTFEKLMTICERKGLITKPRVKRDDKGNVTALTSGHMWRLMGQGWINPSEPWVAINNEDRGSLFHVYNILTGAITHKPSWTDGSAAPLGGSVLNFNTFTERLQTVHKVLGDITTKVHVNDKSIEEQLEHVPVFSSVIH